MQTANVPVELGYFISKTLIRLPTKWTIVVFLWYRYKGSFRALECIKWFYSVVCWRKTSCICLRSYWTTNFDAVYLEYETVLFPVHCFCDLLLKIIFIFLISFILLNIFQDKNKSYPLLLGRGSRLLFALIINLSGCFNRKKTPIEHK